MASPMFDKKLTLEDIYSEVLDIFADMGFSEETYWHDSGGPLVKKGEKEEGEADSKESVGDLPSAVDPRRVAFLRRLKGSLFGLVNREGEGFDDYRAHVYENFVYLEHPKTNNAAYFFDVETISRGDLPKDPEAFGQWRDAQPWLQLIRGGSRKEWRQAGAEKFVHNTQGGPWETRLDEKIKNKLGLQ